MRLASCLARPITRIFGALIALLLVLVLGVPAALGAVGTPKEGLPLGIGLRLLDVPVNLANNPRANDYIVDHAIPGSVVRRSIEVSNGTDEPLPVRLFGVRASVEQEWLVLGMDPPPGPSELAAWITVEPSDLLLAPQSVATAEVTITVPAGIADGERYAAVVAEPPPLDAGNGLGLVSRVAIRTYLSVGADGVPITDFEIKTLTARRSVEGVPIVDVAVHNTGALAIDVSGELILRSADGVVTAGPFPTVLPATLGAGRRGQVAIEIPRDLGAGPWVVTATMRSGLTQRQVEATVTFPDAAGESADAVLGLQFDAQRRLLLPIAAGLLLLALAGLCAMLVARRQDDWSGR